MKYFFTADMHMGHSNIIKYCKRPFGTVQEMDWALIKNWNSVVTNNDIVFHIGDFAFKNFDAFKEFLQGQIIFIKGNHDEENKIIIEDCVINFNQKNIYLNHFPDLCKAEYNLCGHIHDKWKAKVEDGKYIINVGCDVWNYKPVSLQQIIEEFKHMKNQEVKR
jgi:calcineurin-like phosphoesterase family protein